MLLFVYDSQSAQHYATVIPRSTSYPSQRIHASKPWILDSEETKRRALTDPGKTH